MGWWRASSPNAIPALPWLSPAAVCYFESLLAPDFDVIEHGSGGSTLWLAERVRSVESYEDDPDWFRAVNRACPDNSIVILNGNPSCCKQYDLLFIDGEPVEDRACWLSAADSLVRKGGYLVLDNANRPEYAVERTRMQESFNLLYTADGNVGNARYLITEFYRKKP